VDVGGHGVLVLVFFCIFEVEVKTTQYFQEQILTKRTYLTLEMCVYVISNPLKTEIQEDGRKRYWGFVPELNKIIRVVVLEDGETIHNAFMDRSFKS
jgi:hypothetical protein